MAPSRSLEYEKGSLAHVSIKGRFVDISESLKAAENSLRDLLNFVLSNELGEDWFRSCGVSDGRVEEWEKRKSVDEKKFGHADPRMIYYADFYDLKTIVRHNWNRGLSDVFGKLKELEILLGLLDDLRNPDAHRRELLPYQRHLALGISGKIRSKITEYFCKMETGKSYYSRIESVQDSLGNTWAIGERNSLDTGCVLRPGDQLQFKVVGADPLGEPLEFATLPMVAPHEFSWSSHGDFDLTIESNHIQEKLWIFIAVRSRREFHAKSAPWLGKVDDIVKFGYEVLPPRR